MKGLTSLPQVQTKQHSLIYGKQKERNAWRFCRNDLPLQKIGNMNTIQKQLDYYQQNKTDILSHYAGMIIVVSPDLQITTFKSLEDGYKYGVGTFGYGNFMLKDCTSQSLNMTHRVSPTISVEV